MSTIFCVCAWPGVPSVPPCRARDVHLETCADDECRGCFPKGAEVGFLCASHFDRVTHSYSRWSEFERRVGELGLTKAVQRDNAGVRTRVDGHANLTLAFLAMDECSRFLASAAGHRSLELWVHTEQGASDAIQFAAAAERAYRAVEVEERPHKVRRVRCPQCAHELIWNPPAWFEGAVAVKCADCAHVLDQDEFEALEATG